MKMNDLVDEGRVGKAINWAIDKLAGPPKTPKPRIEPELDAAADAIKTAPTPKPPKLEPQKPAKPLEPKKPRQMDQETWDKLTPKQKQKLDARPAPKQKAAEPEVAPEAPPVDQKPGLISRTKDDVVDWAKENPKTAAATAWTAGSALDAQRAPEGEKLDRFSADMAVPIQVPLNIAKHTYNGVAGTDKKEKPAEPVADPNAVPASTNAGAPDSDPDYIPPAPAAEPTKESILTILKLSGQKPITERDNIMGIIKPKAIQTLTESAVNECGMMGAPSSTTASLSINATASSGDEVANMLASIMKLAGVQPVNQEMMPQNDNAGLSMVRALDIMGGKLDDEPMSPSEPDSMNATDLELDAGIPDDVNVAHGDIDNDGDHDMDDHEAEGDKVTVRNVDTGEEFEGKTVVQSAPIKVRNVDTGEEFEGRKSTDEEYANTPTDPNDVPEWDPEKMVFRPNQAGQFDRMDGTMPKGVPAMEQVEKLDTVSKLLKEYEAFKNGQ